MSTTKPKDYYLTQEVASLLDVSPKTVARWANEGRPDPATGRPLLSYRKTPGGHKRYRREPIDAYVAREAEASNERDNAGEQSVWVRA